MAKYLLFRTDRIGDFIFSRIIIDAIKKKNPNNTIDIVCSEYNANYVKNFRDINEIYIYNKYKVILNIKNLINLNSKRYDYLLVLDGKRRSIFLSLLINAKIKIALITLIIIKIIISKKKKKSNQTIFYYILMRNGLKTFILMTLKTLTLTKKILYILLKNFLKNLINLLF